MTNIPTGERAERQRGGGEGRVFFFLSTALLDRCIADMPVPQVSARSDSAAERESSKGSTSAPEMLAARRYYISLNRALMEPFIKPP